MHLNGHDCITKSDVYLSPSPKEYENSLSKVLLCTPTHLDYPINTITANYVSKAKSNALLSTGETIVEDLVRRDKFFMDHSTGHMIGAGHKSQGLYYISSPFVAYTIAHLQSFSKSPRASKLVYHRRAHLAPPTNPTNSFLAPTPKPISDLSPNDDLPITIRKDITLKGDGDISGSKKYLHNPSPSKLNHVKGGSRYECLETQPVLMSDILDHITNDRRKIN
ncbi:hypothetical protein CR513_21548, partial [Mucuna pruriens]